MNRTTWLHAAALALGSALCFSALAQSASPSATPAKAKVVFQMSDADPAKWNLALNNARNVQQELGADKVEIAIVAYGPGIGMLKADALAANRVGEAARAGVQMLACENTLTVQKIAKADMNTAISYVPAGVVELMQRQREGWAYIRP